MARPKGANGTGIVVHSAVPVVRSEGQRMLLHVTGSLAAIADEIGASAQSVHDWRTGKKKPSIDARARMQLVFGIPAEVWARKPTSDVTGDSAVEEPDEPPPANTVEHCRQLLETIRRERMQTGLMPSERVKLAQAEAQILALRARLEQAAELSEDRYVREHPAWRRMRAAIIKALVAHPAAAKAVADALRDLEA